MPLIVCQTMQRHHSTTIRIKRLYFDTVTVEIHHYCKKKKITSFTTKLSKKGKETEDPLYQCMCPSEDENVLILMLFPMLILDHTLFLACKNTLLMEITRHSCDLAS